MNSAFRRAFVATLVAVAAGLSLPARAQDFPNRPLTLVVGSAAGSGADSLARIFHESTIGPMVRPNRRVGAACG